MAYDNAVVEEIRQRNDIVEVISSFVTLKRAGANYNGLCPFHSEKSPSFTVFPATSSFYCFGCGAGGDVLTFIMKAENVDFSAAMEQLAARAGITLPQDRADSALAAKRRRTLDMNREAARFFHNKLMEGGAGMHYLADERKLSGATIKHFGLGYAPDSYFALTDHLRKLGYSDEELIDGYFARRSEKTGKIHDLFRNRVMFPIIDVSGNVVAFGGRVLDDSKPKYLNSSDTPAFRKSKVLYALNYAKNHTEDGLILCEGYMDVIALHAAGFPSAVATLGTAITPEHARLFRHYTDRVTISYDADEAGQRAAQRAFSILEQAGVQTRILRIEGAKDPDEYIRKFGTERFRRVLKGSVSRFDYTFDNITKKYDLSNLDDKVKAVAECAAFIASVESEVERELYIQRVSQKLEFSADSLKNDVAHRRKRDNREQHQKDVREIMLQAGGVGDKLNPDRMKNARAAGAENAILSVLLCYPEHLATATEKYGLVPDDFVTELNRRIFSCILQCRQDGGDLSQGALNQYLNADEMGYITKLKLSREDLNAGNNEQVLADCIHTLKSSKSKDLEEILNVKRRKNSAGSNADR